MLFQRGKTMCQMYHFNARSLHTFDHWRWSDFWYHTTLYQLLVCVASNSFLLISCCAESGIISMSGLQIRQNIAHQVTVQIAPQNTVTQKWANEIFLSYLNSFTLLPQHFVGTLIKSMLVFSLRFFQCLWTK